MINTDRIVPITVIDLISFYALILQLNGQAVDALGATTADGQFNVTESDSSDLIADEPVRSLNFEAAVTTSYVYFVAAYDYEGFTINDTAVTTAGVTVNPDGRTLYKASLSSGRITITQIGF